MSKVNYLIGRENENEFLLDCYDSQKSKMIAVIGRRRVGKTYLIKSIFEDVFDFDFTGTQNSTREELLQSFAIKLNKYDKKISKERKIRNWIEAFDLLQSYLSKKKKNEKKVVFFDELPWMDTPKSGFVEKFAHFWNDWAERNNVLLIVCGSAATWMIRNIAEAKGGLHNRLTRTMYIKPFTLSETASFLNLKRVSYTTQQLYQTYMTVGGIPFYLDLFERKNSINQNIQNLLLHTEGALYKEFDVLFKSLFANSKIHYQIIDILCKKWKGFTRQEMVQYYKGSDGGTFTDAIDELIKSGFVSKYQPFHNQSKEMLYRISDPYVWFHKKIVAKRKEDNETIENYMETPAYKSWCGYAFENVCMAHIPEIKKELGIHKIQTSASSFYYRGNENTSGFQVDLVLDRADGIINLCEMKFANVSFTIDKNYYNVLKERKSNFKKYSETNKSIYFTLITLHGVKKNAYSSEVMDSEVTGNNLIYS